MIGKLQRIVAVTALVAATAGCSTTRVTAVWKSEDYTGGPLENVLVIGVFQETVFRRILEDEFARRLEERGTTAIQSYKLIPSEAAVKKEVIDEVIAERGVDSVLISRVVDRRIERTYYPSSGYSNYYGNWYGYYSYSHVDPGYMVEEEIVSVETNVYKAGSENLIYSASTETRVEGSREQLARSFAERLVANLTKNGLLEAPPEK